MMMVVPVGEGLRDGNRRDAESGRGDQGQKERANLGHGSPGGVEITTLRLHQFPHSGKAALLTK